ncbi:MAG TPA: hypothetical protein VF332_04615 [Vicinamibacterales bacterium]
MGTTWSSSLCRTSVGTSNALRSSVKSVSENALIRSNVFSREILVELRAVGEAAAADPVEHLNRQAGGIGSRLQHQRRDGGDQRSLGHAFRAVAANIAGHFAAARREADQRGAIQAERFDELREIVGIGVHVVATPGLARPAMAATVMGNAPIAVGGGETPSEPPSCPH